MTPRPPATDEPALAKKLVGWRDRLVDLLVVGLPTLILNQLYKQLSDRLFEQPWQALWFLVPLAGAAWIAWQVLVRRRRRLLLRGPLLVFLGIFVALFSIAAQSELLDWRRDLVGPGAGTPRSWLLPVRFGDWRYWLARHAPGPQPTKDLLVVTVPPPPNLAAGREQILKLIALAVAHGAHGIAFDFHLRAEDSPLDPVLCATIDRARKKGVRVLFGERLAKGLGGTWRPERLASKLEACLPDEDRGHLMVLRDVDGRVRLLPLRFGRGEGPALSVRVVAAIEGVPVDKLDLPADGYLQPVPPPGGYRTIAYAELEKPPPRSFDLAAEVRDSFLLVGEDSPAETFSTPLGPRLGVLIHADAIEALRTGTELRHSPAWLTFGVIFFLCYLVTALAAGGTRARNLLWIACGASGLLLGASALAVWLSRLWVDVVYGLVAVWLLVALLLVLRRLLPMGPSPRPG